MEAMSPEAGHGRRVKRAWLKWQLHREPQRLRHRDHPGSQEDLLQRQHDGCSDRLLGRIGAEPVETNGTLPLRVLQEQLHIPKLDGIGVQEAVVRERDTEAQGQRRQGRRHSEVCLGLLC